MARRIRQAGCCLLITLFCCRCSPAPEEGEAAPPNDPDAVAVLTEPVLPLDSPPDAPVEILELGRMLYHDTALSGPQRAVSCATCHPLDGEPGTTGATPEAARTGSEEPWDIPTVYNSGAHFAYFWNGRAQSLEGVIQASIRAENIMDASWPAILEALASKDDYADRFERAYPGGGITEANVEDALAGFVRSLSTPNAAFDRWLGGEDLPAPALAGYALFKDLGCVRCHQGALAGGNMFASFEGYIKTKETLQNADLGRFNVTNRESDRYHFKVPSLRNVTVTAPYFHDGSAKTLEDAVRAMALHQLDRTLTDEETGSIVAFLASLTGRVGGNLLGGPQGGAAE